MENRPARRSIFSRNTFAIYRRKNAQSGMRPVACCVPRSCNLLSSNGWRRAETPVRRKLRKGEHVSGTILTRDIPGYRIFKHTDSLWKGMTVQFYLPADNSTPHIGTIFHEVLPNGRKPKKAQMPFSPNTGYAFAVADNTWHSADPVGPEVKTRDSILLTYFVDAGPWRFVRNRGRRVANFVLNEARNLKRN